MSINEVIAERWDNNVGVRLEDLKNRTDISYTNYIIPFVLKNLKKYASLEDDIIDVGCGCGYLTNEIYNSNYKKICGVDISSKSIKCAKNNFKDIVFKCEDIYVAGYNNCFNIFISVMLLNNMPDINSFFDKMKNTLKQNGKGIIVIPHPSFWTIKHINDSGFDYLNESVYEIPFKTKGRSDYKSSILFFHRPLQSYVRSIIDSGFKIVEFCELPDSETPLIKPDLLGIVIEKQ